MVDSFRRSLQAQDYHTFDGSALDSRSDLQSLFLIVSWLQFVLALTACCQSMALTLVYYLDGFDAKQIVFTFRPAYLTLSDLE